MPQEKSPQFKLNKDPYALERLWTPEVAAEFQKFAIAHGILPVKEKPPQPIISKPEPPIKELYALQITRESPSALPPQQQAKTRPGESTRDKVRRELRKQGRQRYF